MMRNHSRSRSNSIQTRRAKWTKFKLYLHNKDEGTYCNRKPYNWARIFLYVTVFNGCIFSMFLVCFFYSEYYLGSKDKPFIEKATIGVKTPSITFIPNSIDYNAPLLEFSSGKANSLVKTIDSALRKYEEVVDNLDEYTNCSKSEPEDGVPCMFTLDDLGPCGKDEYGYDDNKPCVYFRLNKLVDWTPDPYQKDDDLDYLPSEVAEEVTRRNENATDYLWFHCAPPGGLYEEHFHISYYPKNGYALHFFPFKNEKYYVPPLVAIQFDKLELHYTYVLECSIYARNIDKEYQEKRKATLVVYVSD